MPPCDPAPADPAPSDPTSRDPRAHWNQRYRSGSSSSAAPSSFVTGLAGRLPRPGRALDLAGGRGRHALWLARLGWDVTLTDIAGEGLALARAAAEKAGLELTTLERDVEQDGLPPGPWDLILCTHFLHRPLFGAFAEALAPGGLLIFEHPTRSNLERNAKPSARFLLEDGELLTLLTGLEVLAYDEGWNEAGRHEARLLARLAGERPTEQHP